MDPEAVSGSRECSSAECQLSLGGQAHVTSMPGGHHPQTDDAHCDGRQRMLGADFRSSGTVNDARLAWGKTRLLPSQSWHFCCTCGPPFAEEPATPPGCYGSQE